VAVRVLVAEDFEILARSIGTGLRREGMAVDVVLDGTDALDHVAVTRYEVVVAGLRTLLEVALADRDADADTLRSTCQEALALGEHQERLVRGMLALATSERGLTRSETFDLAQVTTGVLDSRRDQATRLGIDLTEHLAPALTAGDPRSVESLNRQPDRQRHPAQRPGRARRGHHAVLGPALDLTVTNSGPVVPDDEIQRHFQSFQRLASDRHSRNDGYGLGLAIVNAVAQANHAISPAPRAPKEA
jgi:signal transduction histidine kinase